MRRGPTLGQFFDKDMLPPRPTLQMAFRPPHTGRDRSPRRRESRFRRPAPEKKQEKEPVVEQKKQVEREEERVGQEQARVEQEQAQAKQEQARVEQEQEQVVKEETEKEEEVGCRRPAQH